MSQVFVGEQTKTGAPGGAPYPVAEAPGGVISPYHRPPSVVRLMHSKARQNLMIRSQSRRVFSAVGVLLALGAITGCAMFFPSRPLSDAIHIRNSSDSVDLLFCGTMTVDFQLLSRGIFRGERVGLPVAPGVIEVDEASATPFSAVTTLPEGSSHLLPLEAEEQVGFSFRDEDRVLHSGDFQLSEEILLGFEDGNWLATDGTLSIEPCE